ncbi:MAG: sporulation protein YunB [Bacillota bacterium]
MRRRKRRPGHAGRSWLVVLVLALALLGGWALERALVPTLLEVCRVQVTMIANDLVNHTITTKIVRMVQYRDLIYFDKDSNGDIVYMQANTMEINRIEMVALSSLQESVRALQAYQIQIPLGQLTGSKLFSTLGPRIPVTIYPLAEVKTQVRDEFEAVGINQTRHNIILDVWLRVDIIVPMLRTETILENSVLLSSVIIQGRVPSTYVHIHR